jgi:hypothetical protein
MTTYKPWEEGDFDPSPGVDQAGNLIDDYRDPAPITVAELDAECKGAREAGRRRALEEVRGILAAPVSAATETGGIMFSRRHFETVKHIDAELAALEVAPSLREGSGEAKPRTIRGQALDRLAQAVEHLSVHELTQLSEKLGGVR